MNNQLIEELYKTIEAKDNIINNQALEIARLKDKLKEITKRIRKAIDDDEEDLLYVLFDIQDIIQDEEEQKRAFDKYIKPYIRDKETEETFNNFNGWR